MIRLTRTVMAGLIASTAWAPAWRHFSFGGPATLDAQQSTARGVSKADSDDDSDNDADADTDSDADQAPPAHGRATGSPRTLEVARMLHPARDLGTPLHVDVSYGTGSLSLSPAEGPWLYDVHLRYLPGRGTPNVVYDSLSHSLHASGSKHGDNVDINFGEHEQRDDDLHVALGRTVPLDLSLHFGAGDVRAQLGGLSVQRLKIETGAAHAVVSFDSPDPVPLDDLEIKVGATGFEATGLGNAHVRHIVVQAIAGDVDLDFGGHWTSDATLEVQAAVGAVHIHVPSNVAVDQSSTKVIIGSSGDMPGVAAPQTPGGQIYHLHVKSTTTLGSIDYDRKTHD